MPYRRTATKQYSQRRRRTRLETWRSRKWGEVKYPRGTQPVVVETKIESLVQGQPATRTIVIKEGLGVKKPEEVKAIMKALEIKAASELPADAKAEFSIYLPKTRRKPIKFVAVGRQPIEPRLVLPPGGFDVPEYLREDIKEEWRKHPKRKTATDLEAMAYLMSASALGPFDKEHHRIYLYLARKYLKKKGWKKFAGGMAFLNEYKSLTDYEKHLLQKLKDRIWKLQQKDLKERQKRAKKLLKEVEGK